MSKLPHLLTAYRGTGKDTLFRELSTNQLLWDSAAHHDQKSCRWVVFAKPRAPSLYAPLSSHIARFAFADELKRKTHIYLRLIDCPPHAFEAVKDTLVVPSPVAGDAPRLLRDWYIHIAMTEREKDPDVWVKSVCERLLYHSSGTAMITDWRFRNEAPAMQCKTVRVRLFRPEVPIPDKSVVSEHDLDSEQTDYLLVPKVTDFGAALQQFPQYAGYVPCETLHTRAKEDAR